MKCFVENGYTQYLSTRGLEGAGLQTAIIGLGSYNTWHGTPDVRVRGTEIVVPCSEEDDASD